MPINRLCARRHPRRALTGPPIHAALPAALAPTALAKNDLQALSLEDLMSVAVASVSGKAEPLQDGATAVFVLTQDDLKQSGATSISDALRNRPATQPNSLRSFAIRDAELLVNDSQDASAQNVQQCLCNWQARPTLAQNMAMARLHCKAATQRGGFVAIVVNHEHPGRHAAAGQTTPTVRTVQRCA